MSKINYDSALVIGMGLIGSSIARVLKEKNLSKKIFAIDKNIDVDLDVYQNIINQISDDLSVKYVDINKFDRQSVKKLFMSEYLYRVDKNIIIG